MEQGNVDYKQDKWTEERQKSAVRGEHRDSYLLQIFGPISGPQDSSLEGQLLVFISESCERCE